jgi:hypothetical protein
MKIFCDCPPSNISIPRSSELVVFPVFHSWRDHLLITVENILRLNSLGKKILLIYPCDKIKLLTISYENCEYRKKQLRIKRNIDHLLEYFHENADVILYKVCTSASHIIQEWETNMISSREILSLFGNKDMGNVILSEAIDKYGGTDDLTYKWKMNLIIDYINQYLSFEKIILEIISDLKIENIFIFNGRFLFDGIFQSFASNHNIDIFYYERGGELKDYDVYKHKSQDINKLISRIKAQAYNLDKSGILQGLGWYTKRIKKSTLIKKLVNRLYLKYFSNNKRNIIFFMSSINEWIIVGENWSKYFLNQYSAIKYLVSQFDQEQFKIFVRIHPGMRKRPRAERVLLRTALKKIPQVKALNKYPFLCSYELVRQADVVATYGSTIGVESIVMGKVPITMSQSMYEKHKPKKISLNNLRNINHTSHRYLAAYGYFSLQRGFLFNFVIQSDIKNKFSMLFKVSKLHQLLCFINNSAVLIKDRILYKIIY